jgi:hypothetical protein
MSCCVSTTDWPTLGVALLSLIVAVVSVWFAVQSLRLASTDWRQRKWFELYFKASEACHFLEYFQRQHAAVAPGLRGLPPVIDDFNMLMFKLRDAHSMAVVFPINPAIHGFLASTAVFENLDEAFSPERLTNIENAVEELRQKALLDVSVLKSDK